MLAFAMVACGGRQTEVEHARRARYDAELPTLIAETAEVVRSWYPTIEVDPQGTIQTKTTADHTAARRKYFVRFHIVIANQRPSRIDVVGHAAEMTDGMRIPDELPREKEPEFTSELADKLRLEIHEKLARYAR